MNEHQQAVLFQNLEDLIDNFSKTAREGRLERLLAASITGLSSLGGDYQNWDYLIDEAMEIATRAALRLEVKP